MSLISDAGTPSLSDPGRILVNFCIENKIQIIPIPGVSALTAALSVSGFKDQFLFYGFLPKTENELEKVLSSLSQNEYTLVFFAPSKKINFYIKGFKKFFSGRKILIAKLILITYKTIKKILKEMIVFFVLAQQSKIHQIKMNIEELNLMFLKKLLK